MNLRIKKTILFLLFAVSLSLPFLLLLMGLNSENLRDEPSNLEQSTAPSRSEPDGTSDPTTDPTSPNISNIDRVRNSDGALISDSFQVTDAFRFHIDAQVSTANVERVSLYEYIPVHISDDQRVSFLEAYFQERVGEVYHHTVGNSNCWLLLNDTEYYHFGYNRSPRYIDESGFSLTNHKVGLVSVRNGMRDSLDDVGFPLSDAFSQCDILIESLVGDIKYIPSIIRPISTAGPDGEGVYWIVYRKELDGMPVVANWDLKFFVTQDEVVKTVGTLYDVRELSLTENIISVEDALESLKKYAPLIDFEFLEIERFFGDTVPVSEITFEYLVLPGYGDYNYVITPVWRFQLGETEEQRTIHRDKVIAINALTGELIAQYRGS